MKLAFSTLACPAWDFEEIFSTAVDFGFDGIEIRGISTELYAPRIKAFLDENIDKTLSILSKRNMAISCLTSSACLADKGKIDSAIKEVKEYIDLAEKLRCRYVRVMSTGVPHRDEGDIELCKTQYEEVCRYGEQRGVTPIMETNAMFVDTKLLRDFMQSIGSENKGVLWDVNHPYRFNGESAHETVENIGEFIKYVHIKDSIEKDGETVYKLLGYGDVPVKEAVKALRKRDFDGFMSLEWVKRWNKSLEEPYIVIPNYAGYMKALIQ